MNLGIVGHIGEIVKQYHTIELQLKTAAETITLLKSEFAAMRTELLELRGKVAALEESRNTLKEQMERVKEVTLAQMDARIAKHEAELALKFMEAVAAVKQQPAGTAIVETPKIEK